MIEATSEWRFPIALKQVSFLPQGAREHAERRQHQAAVAEVHVLDEDDVQQEPGGHHGRDPEGVEQQQLRLRAAGAVPAAVRVRRPGH